ncbi:MAG: flagellar filament capping protein FliD [Lachnospiraceae bacterium]|nr:flagellar filament capping protein FliD [Lachnospiraceae bacterium]
MAGISGLGSGIDYSVLFGTSSDKQSSSTDYSSILNLDLTEVASVRKGSYGKLLKSYYAQEKAEAKSSVGDTDAKLTSIKSDADKLAKAADALGSSSLYKTKTVTDDNGKQSEVLEDPSKAAGAVKDFVKAYNAAIDSAGDSETKSVLRQGGWMANMSKQNARLLAEVGITIGSDDKLSFNEDTFKKANTTTVKELFSGVDSYASQVWAKAGSISRATQNAGAATYNASGNWSTQANTMAKESIAKLSGNTEEKDEEETDPSKKITINEDALQQATTLLNGLT